MVKVSDHSRQVMSLSPVPLKTRRVEQLCTLNMSRAQTSSRWCGVVVRRGGASHSLCSGFLILKALLVVPYRRGLLKALYQHDNAKPHVAHRVLIFFNSQGIRLLPWPAQSPNLSSIAMSTIYLNTAQYIMRTIRSCKFSFYEIYSAKTVTIT
ncbi:hypothetical protein TNCV_3596221 [Trichonephila clavipes]|nr:hypothetical protein TNCV_3596221 [Trichonephila clavipes]